MGLRNQSSKKDPFCIAAKAIVLSVELIITIIKVILSIINIYLFIYLFIYYIFIILNIGSLSLMVEASKLVFYGLLIRVFMEMILG